ncbi:hypothetical protein [Armatimonas sp.]|uniref:hypothetical protein n=1 Tax=Armatimonas sp. TaxID=1872638 RepID=UPI00286C0F2D|nr:hypothetical protein [Armatimonas sp.]
MTQTPTTKAAQAASPLELLSPFVPVPAIYIDQVMPTLSDSEWRILCVIIRQTLGWVDEESTSGRKERDWITQSQFREKTGGKSRDSISLGIASLVKRGLIVVENREGKLLSTPKSRQTNRDRLYFRLVPIEELERENPS